MRKSKIRHGYRDMARAVAVGGANPASFFEVVIVKSVANAIGNFVSSVEKIRTLRAHEKVGLGKNSVVACGVGKVEANVGISAKMFGNGDGGNFGGGDGSGGERGRDRDADF